jgi:serine/threonine protein kinase
MNTPCSIALLESALTGNLSADDEASVHRHLEECPQCSAALERMAGGPAWCDEAAALLAKDELDTVLPGYSRAGGDDWSDADFSVEHLEPADESGVLGRLGGYQVLEIIGRGGMGVVLKAFDPALKRCVAIKVLTPHLAQSSLARKRFAREAQAAAAVVHPNVLAIHNVQPGGRLPFLVMPLVAGESLAQRLAQQGRLELNEVLRVGMQVAAGLGAAHEQGLVHRDVKPANILLEKGVERAVITDFGLARAADDVALTRWGIIAGTPQYMSPEQARGEPLDARSDLFSLGCVLYEMATGVSPFRADSMMATMRRLVDDAPQSVLALNPELPPWFAAIVDRLLEKDPSRRFATAREVSELLEGCLAHVQQPGSVPLPAALPAPVTRRSAGPHNIFFKGIIAMIATLGVALLGMLLVQSTEPPDIAGKWAGEGWGQVQLDRTAAGDYAGTYSDTAGKTPGKIQLQWSRIERRFNGDWGEGEIRFGRLSVRLVDHEIRGAFTTDAKSKTKRDTPQLAEIIWSKATGDDENAAGDRYSSTTMQALFCQGKPRAGLQGWEQGWKVEAACLVNTGTRARIATKTWYSKEDLIVSAFLSLDALNGSGAVFTFGDGKVFEFDRPGGQFAAGGLPLVRGRVSSSAAVITPGKPFLFRVEHNGSLLDFFIDDKLIQTVEYSAQMGSVGFAPKQATMRIHSFAITQMWPNHGRTLGSSRQPGQGGPNLPAESASPPAPAATPALLAQRPQLQFLAWQEEFRINQPRGAFRADGSPANSPSELKLLNFVQAGYCDASNTAADKRNPSFLHLWFSHPLFEDQSLGEVTLLDGAGKPRPPGASGMLAKSAEAAKDLVDRDDHLGWLTYTLSPGSAPSIVTVRLRYTFGPWERPRLFAPDQNGIVALGNGSQFNGAGQDAEGKAFFAIAVDTKQDAERQFGVEALTKDGRALQYSRVESGGGNGQPVHVQRFSFAASLSEITHFRLSTRPVKTVDFQNVSLPPQDAADRLLAGQPPVVVETFPVSGARDVAPGAAEIRVRFSKPMADGSWSWSTAWKDSTPDFIGQPHYEPDGRTCAAKVKLEAGRTYAFWLNSEKFENFKDRDGRPAVPYLLIFQTKPK